MIGNASDINFMCVSGRIVSDIKVLPTKNGKEYYSWFIESQSVKNGFTKKINIKCNAFYANIVSRLGMVSKGAKIILIGKIASYASRNENGGYDKPVTYIEVTNVEIPDFSMSSVESFVKAEGVESQVRQEPKKETPPPFNMDSAPSTESGDGSGDIPF